MRIFRSPDSHRGAAVLAALMLVGAVGVFSLALHYLQPFYSVAYQPHTQTAALPDINTSIPGTVTGGTSAPPSTTQTKATDIPGCEPGKEIDPKTNQRYCRCNGGQQSTASPAQAATGGSASTGGASSYINITGSCLQGCTYKYYSIQKDGAAIANRVILPDDNASMQPGKTCRTYTCADSTNNTCTLKETAGEATVGAPSNGASPSPEVPKQPQNLNNTAKEIVAAMGSGNQPLAYDLTNASLQQGISPADLNAAINSAAQGQNTGSTNSGNGSLADLQTKLRALAGQPLQAPGVPQTPPAVVPGGGVADICAQHPEYCRLQPPGGGQPQNLQGPRGPLSGSTFGGGGLMSGLFSMFGGGGGGVSSGIMSFAQGFMRGMMGGGLGGGGYGIPPGNSIPQYPGTCNTQYMCASDVLLYRDNQCIDQPLQRCQYGCDPSGTRCAQQYGQNGQYGYGTDNQPCMPPPLQPNSASCTVGTWKSVSATRNGCTTGWQCVASGQHDAPPTATLSCQSQVADAGSNFRISYTCQNASTSAGEGFDTGGQLTGIATVVIDTPPDGYDTATYSLACANGAQTVGAQCSVQVNAPQIALTATPDMVPAGAPSTIGWVTSGMRSCTISSPDIPGFTAQNAGYTNVNGAVATPPLTATSRVLLDCKTFGGGTRTASMTITVQ